MNKFSAVILTMILVSGWGITFSQCTIDSANTTTGFTPNTPAVIKPGIAYSQTVQVYVPVTDEGYTVDSLHIDSLTGQPSGIDYVFNPSSGTVLGGGNGAICFSGITTDTVGPYPITFYGDIFTNAGLIPFSYLVTVAPTFGYEFKVETAPVAAFTVDSPVCTSADTVEFIDHTTGYPTRWTWTFAGGSPATSTKQFPAVVYDSAGTYTVTLIGRNSISSDTFTQSITVNPSVFANVTTAPAMGDTLVSNGSAIVHVIGGTAPYSYAWSNSTFGDTLLNAVAGIYMVTTTDSKGCQYVNDSVNVSFIFNGLVQLTDKQQVNIYPNPATDELNFVWSKKPNAEISILDLNGNVVRSFMSNGTTVNVYDIRSLASGAYIIRITDKTSNVQHSVLFSKL